MNPTTTALKWGLFIGLANLVWLYVAFWLGLHTSGVMVFQVFMLIWLAVTLTGFILALRAVRGESVSWSYWKGLRAGALAALVTALVAVAAQVGYFSVVHPAWPQVMVEQTREYLAALGKTEAEIETAVEATRRSVTLVNYAISSAVTALVTGVVLSAIIMIFLRRRKPSGAAAFG